ncbi:short-chain collagen C4-like [Mercenaria mercenaria]|uniref:short-chain collagen C4-like n=1 Tax=Mercenaria mercenaria TaxID=6596 RepID=UPI00234EC71C|nr:short-chain collagen C4-like [Mercenaria mercenaria]XP_053404680.1 short-chain collagen C4-like [Mercenaria mercenaria]
MKTASFFSLLKHNGHVLLSLSGIGCLVLSLFLIASFNSESDRRYNEILDHLAEMKKGGGSMNTDISLKHEGLKGKFRIKREDTESENRTPSKGGAVYIRWGRKTCPENGTELVYQGFGAGSWHESYGAATNLQCLPNNPVWGRYTDKAGSAYIYGMEFKETLDGLIDTSNFQKPLTNHNVPCAVCRSKERISSFMVPARFACYNGWHLEYHGYLMAGSSSSKSGTQYICVDEAPEADDSGYRVENGALLYKVTGQCGSMPCPKYVQNRELACAVCTK